MRIERLEETYNLDSFECGKKALDDWLQRHALENQKRDITRTFLLLSDSDELLGFYSLTMGGVKRRDLPKTFRSGPPNYDIGMVLLARFAIGVSRRGQGLGRDLLVVALKQAAIAGENAAARFIAVDPIDAEAITFYQHFGFITISGSDPERMFIPIDVAIATLFPDSYRPV